MSSASFRVEPIGILRTDDAELATIPRQPAAAQGRPGRIELFPGRGLEDAVRDLEGFDRIWVLAWFDRADGWSPTVLPPRSTVKRGLFATRAPRRPNPIALSALRLVCVSGLCLEVEDVDLADETPVLDIKAYFAWTDAWPDARSGWLADETERAAGLRPADPGPRYDVLFDDVASAQLAFLEEVGVRDLEHRLVEALRLGPSPHAYRRIRVMADGTRRIAVKEWRAIFVADGLVLRVNRIASGYSAQALHGGGAELDVHRAFVARFPSP